MTRNLPRVESATFGKCYAELPTTVALDDVQVLQLRHDPRQLAPVVASAPKLPVIPIAPGEYDT